MALLKKLFNKDSQEVKEFWKAFTKLYKKVNQKNLDAFLAAQKACPGIWKGPFLLSLIYDVQNDIPSDPEKARTYRDQALNAAKGTEDQRWVENFYGFYETPAINWRKADKAFMTEEVHAIRRLGVAAMGSYECGKPVIVAHDEFDDAVFWQEFFYTCSFDTDERNAFIRAFTAWNQYKNGRGKEDDIRFNTNELIVSGNKSMKKYDKLKTREEKGKEVEEYEYKSFTDMFLYVSGYYRVLDGPFLFDRDDYVRQCGGEIYSGIDCFRSAAIMGCGPAVHYLVGLAHASDAQVRNILYRGLKVDMDVDAWLKIYLIRCANAGDSEARRLLNLYYSEV